MFLVLKSYTFLAPLSDPIFGSEMGPEPKRGENHGNDMFFLLQSFTFLAPLSDPIFGAENALEPKWKEHYGIGMFLILKTIHVWHPSRIQFLASKWLRPNGQKTVESIVFLSLQSYTIPGPPVGSDVWLRKRSGAQT